MGHSGDKTRVLETVMSVPLSKSSVFPDETNEENEQGNGPEHGIHMNPQTNRVPTDRTLPGGWMNRGIDHHSNHNYDKQTHRNQDECEQSGQYALHVDHRVTLVFARYPGSSHPAHCLR